MKAKRNTKERTWSTVAQAVLAGGATEGLEAAMPFLQGGDYATAGKVLVFTILMGALAWAKNWAQNQMPERAGSTQVEE